MIMSKTKKEGKLQIIRSRSGSTVKFPQNGLLQREPEHESTGLFIRNPEHKRFGVITRLDGNLCKIILEPDEALAQAMKKTAPSKVFLIDIESDFCYTY